MALLEDDCCCQASPRHHRSASFCWTLLVACVYGLLRLEGVTSFAPPAAVGGLSRWNAPSTSDRSSVLLHVAASPPTNTGTSTTSPSPSSSSATTAAASIDRLRGDARGAALLLDDVSVYRGSVPILQRIDWRVEPRTKWALVGSNGCGKSTLLKALVGELPFEGRAIIGVQGPVGYLQQTAVAGSSRTVYDEAASGMTELNDAQRAIDRAVELEDLDMLEQATTRFEALGGYQQEQKVSNVLKGLGFTNYQQRCDALSGGWQMRVAFARLLLSDPALCLMDEPGNHLDAAAKTWLAQYLAKYDGNGAMILVTHDVSLLQSMDHMAEIVPGADGLQIYKSCTYDQYLELKEERANAAKADYEKTAAQAAKLQAFVDRFGASATKAKSAQSRVKQLEKMERDGLLDAPAHAIVAQRFKPTLTLPPPPKAVGEALLGLNDASIGHAGVPLLKNVNLEITKGMKLLIRGPNGAGKSTILHALRGKLPLIEGKRVENPTLRLGMFTQDLAQELDPNARAVDVATTYARDGPDGDIEVSDLSARNVMGRLGLQGDKPLRNVRDLSGGERARVCLAMFALKPSNVYLFDEVSNHLDVECVESLGNALSTWGGKTGAFVVVSHDKHFCQKIEFTHVATVQDGKVKVEERNAVESDWIVHELSERARPDEPVKPLDGPTVSKSIPVLDDKQRKLAFNAPKRIAKLEKLVASLEGKIATINDEMLACGSDVGQLMDLTKEREKLEAQVAAYMKEWEELEELLALTA